MTASVVESIRFQRLKAHCTLGPASTGHHCFHYTIGWAGLNGDIHERGVYRCWHPLCDTSPIFAPRGELFSRRYFAEQGPGIYPAPIEETL